MIKQSFFLKLSLICLALYAGLAQASDLSPARIFTDGVVLQREMPVPVWGHAKPGAEVTVTFGGQTKQGRADAAGEWMLRLDPLTASATGEVLTIQSAGETVQVKDVLVGEVWLCGGQSNMAWKIQNLRGKRGKPTEEPVALLVRGEIEKADDPIFRQFHMEVTASPFEEASTIPVKSGWAGVNPTNILQFSAIGYFFGLELRRELDVPVGLIYCNKGGTRVESWLPQEAVKTIEGGSALYAEEMKAIKEKVAAWDARPAVNAEGVAKKGPGPVGNGNVPTTLFNGMVAPLVPYAMRGVIWYQGESNTEYRTAQYRDGFTTLVNSWRSRWGQEPLYFFWCQLANYVNPKCPGWVSVSNQQRESLDVLANSGMAVLRDIGQSDNIHPRNKIDAAKRLSLHALAKAYGRDVVSSGPLFKSARVKANKMVVRFGEAGSGLMVGNKDGLAPTQRIEAPLAGFEIRAAAGEWLAAKATITGKDTVEVWHTAITQPVGVRYAWASNPEHANLYNQEGLPASLFDWNQRPNIIFILTDDQGYGDLGCHGHPFLKTPNLDRLYEQSTRFTDFHASSTCAPSRAALMSGLLPFKVGVTHTILERDRMALSATTVAEVLQSGGYTTGIFGKWHLGEEDAYQPTNRGFDEVFIHGAGGIGQNFPGTQGDVPGNNYFDPVIRHNGTFVKTEGYCTDVFFQQALGWIQAKHEAGEPFFAYIPTNAPHGPFICADKYSDPYLNLSKNGKLHKFYGMITNIDENVGLLMEKLDDWGVAENTLLIFMSDNGSAFAAHNNNMRGKKASIYEGGSRVPLFMRWPGQIDAGVDVDLLTRHVDLFPTLASVAGADIPESLDLDGRSLIPILKKEKGEWADRMTYFHVGRWGKAGAPERFARGNTDPDQAKYTNFAVRNERWRLVGKDELYNIDEDPMEASNVIADHPEIASDMIEAYEKWWDDVRPLMINEDATLDVEKPFVVQFEKQQVEQGIPQWTAPTL